VELRDYLRVVRKRWLVIIAGVILGAAGAGAISLLLTPKYEASTLVFVYVQAGGTANELVQGSAFAQNQVTSYAEAVTTPRVLDPVIRELDLDVSADELAEDIVAIAPLDTVNIRITVTDASPTRAAAIADAVTERFREVIADITKPADGPSQVSLSVLRDAVVPESPVSPDLKINLAIGLAVGLLGGLAFAVFFELIDTRIRTERDVESITSSPIIGRITFDKHAARRPLIVHDDPHSPRAEAFRSLRTSLQFLNFGTASRSFVVTSATADEGKSTTAANLAIAMAATGARVVLVDADLRRPSIADYLGLEGAVGLSDVLIARASLDDVLQRWGEHSLSVLPAGTIPPNPSELLGSPAMLAVLDELEKRFDFVLLDLPPVLPVTDAALVSGVVRGALFVVALGRARKADLASAMATLQGVNAPVSGLILTFVPSRGNGAYSNYSYGGPGRTRTPAP